MDFNSIPKIEGNSEESRKGLLKLFETIERSYIAEEQKNEKI